MKKIFISLTLFFSYLLQAATHDDVEHAVKTIRQEFQATNAIQDYREQTINGEGDFQMEYYFKDQDLKKIIFYYFGGHTESVREFYIKDKALYFVYTVDKPVSPQTGKADTKQKEEKRFYFDPKQKFIRYIDEKGKVHDLEKIPQHAQEEVAERLAEFDYLMEMKPESTQP